MLNQRYVKQEIDVYIGLGTVLLIVLAIWFFRRA
jgi:hypothetical protein